MKKVILIDDEPLARLLLREYLEKYESVEVVAECNDGFEGAKAIAQLHPDLIFLDIQMPKINGFEMLEILQEYPSVIFTTAYDEFALKAFEANALDYLLKPFSQQRFDLAMQKWLANPAVSSEKTENIAEITGKQPDEHLRIVIKDGTEIRIIPTAEVEYLEAYDDYVKIHHKGKTHLKKKTMNYFEKTLDSRQFIRIHRSYIMNINELTKIESFEKNSYLAILRSGARLPISRTAYAPLKEMLGI
ncbi:MAG: LytTR family transcriptional regulator DNA-binding domain-containing protein [Flavobacteriia bacterium]|nr:LytTR family transcriptional regulator DNA-binding domain-containing protein [Flavobacteriia bacterium]OJX35227.1 MAG: DNA-binding response regulator [Flavobacteriia bacterium 40-80]